MKRISYILLLSLFVSICSVSCEKEEAIIPTNKESDRIAELIDLSKPLVKEFKEKHKINLLYNFDDTLDIKSCMYATSTQDLWNKIAITHLKTEEVDYALGKLDEMVLSKLSNDKFKSLLPHTIFIADAVEYPSSSSNPDKIATECSYAESGYGTAIGTEYFYMFSFNKESIENMESSGASGKTQLDRLKGVKMYAFICHIIEKHNLYEEIPVEFYNPVAGLNGTSIDERAKLETTPPIGTGPAKDYYNADWFIGLGMAITSNFPKANSRNYTTAIDVNKNKMFADKKRDFRNFLDVVFCELNQAASGNMTKYYLNAPLFVERMRVVLDLLDRWGIDYLENNPQLAKFKK